MQRWLECQHCAHSHHQKNISFCCKWESNIKAHTKELRERERGRRAQTRKTHEEIFAQKFSLLQLTFFSFLHVIPSLSRVWALWRCCSLERKLLHHGKISQMWNSGGNFNEKCSFSVCWRCVSVPRDVFSAGESEWKACRIAGRKRKREWAAAVYREIFREFSPEEIRSFWEFHWIEKK